MRRHSVIAVTALCSVIIGIVPISAPVIAADGSILDLNSPAEPAHRDKRSYAVPRVDVLGASMHDVGPDCESTAMSFTNNEPLPAEFEFDQNGDVSEFDTPHWQSTVECCDTCGSCGTCECRRKRRRGGWFAEVGASALQSNMATEESEVWLDDFGPAGEIAIGHEWESGLGIRAQAWTYQMEGEIVDNNPLQSSLYRYGSYSYYYYANDYDYNYPFYIPYYSTLAGISATKIEIDATTLFVDFYRKFQARYGELKLGFAPAYAHLEYNFPPFGDGVAYDGGGASLFGEAYLACAHLWRWELGIAGISRFTILTGKWDVDAGTFETNPSESMSIARFGIGPELRFRLDPSSDRYCFLRTLAEFQQWRSDQMGPSGGDTLGLHGVSLNGGFLW